MMTALAAAKAYASTQKSALTGEGGDIGAPTASAGGGFGDMLKSVMAGTLQTTKTAEAQMLAQSQGKGQLLDVVTAVSDAQQSLSTVMAIRDQVITAYQQIMQMPV
ncbi:flagellar hook-basal body complex protein FliE [Phenylobacterium sp.]|uniref:flagellar hook-basal body complex protein FliE n=1 Tax=Phenylobacterium sp. TaxID=1871053 RepID=UPI0011F42132|nr:flagellar hook-basal body complex protein FliE [Phenylobacterium sp.]THD62258.1 MAG: flagellar hook-basal body complex protein FliE [Phenylobacterium sp.]